MTDLTDQEKWFCDAFQAMSDYLGWMDKRWPESNRAGAKVVGLKLELIDIMGMWQKLVGQVEAEDDQDLEGDLGPEVG